jgi:hypothetical protein
MLCSAELRFWRGVNSLAMIPVEVGHRLPQGLGICLIQVDWISTHLTTTQQRNVAPPACLELNCGYGLQSRLSSGSSIASRGCNGVLRYRRVDMLPRSSQSPDCAPVLQGSVDQSSSANEQKAGHDGAMRSRRTHHWGVNRNSLPARQDIASHRSYRKYPEGRSAGASVRL